MKISIWTLLKNGYKIWKLISILLAVLEFIKIGEKPNTTPLVNKLFNILPDKFRHPEGPIREEELSHFLEYGTSLFLKDNQTIFKRKEEILATPKPPSKPSTPLPKSEIKTSQPLNPNTISIISESDSPIPPRTYSGWTDKDEEDFQRILKGE